MPTAINRPSSEIFEKLIGGNEQACREYINVLRMEQDASVLTLCEYLTEAFHLLGDAWACSEISVYREHIASQIGCRLLLDLRSDLPTPTANASRAIGCTPGGDPYSMPTLMVELVLRELKWQARSLGPNLPLEMLAPAIEDVRPDLCWVSISYVDSIERMREQLSFLAELGRRHGVEMICGGQAVNQELRQGLSGICFMDELRELKDFAV